MVKLNPHFAKLSTYFLYPEIEKKVAQIKAKQPGKAMINLSLSDITKPLSPTLLAALCSASQEMGDRNTFRGYGPSQGYAFLREAISYGEYRHLGISSDEIFVSNGAKCDLSHIQEIFDIDNRVAICDPANPVYLDTTILAGRTHEANEQGEYGGVQTIPCLEENNFIPHPPSAPCDLIYLCSPNNPTGTAMDRRSMRQWVDYALDNQSVIIFDGAYEAYISSDDCPHSIYEIQGAKEVAIEVRSFSKTAGFTGLRCSYTVVPKELRANLNGSDVSLHSLWRRRHDTKFGGVPYPIQKCAAAFYSPEGNREVKEIIYMYQERARFLVEGLRKIGLTAYGGRDAPYIWCKAPCSMTSWQFFDDLLTRLQIISVPGPGFGRRGEGFVRLSAFAEPSQLAEGLLRLKNLFKI
ncbi:MAG: dapL [Parachlamydiales bacterium]|nr:dapL [Parachlamydiales bacterium]